MKGANKTTFALLFVPLTHQITFDIPFAHGFQFNNKDPLYHSFRGTADAKFNLTFENSQNAANPIFCPL